MSPGQLQRRRALRMGGWLAVCTLFGQVMAASEPASKTDNPLDWWSLRPLAGVQPPSVKGQPAHWAAQPVDRFIFARLTEKGLNPSPSADRRTLIRRATYDLHGLPPTPDEIEDFLNDTRADAYERLMDRLLASPRYGERWGRHWLDVIRFGESRGFERNQITTTAWPFRDYVIRSFNDDKPFDQFITEHLAGDVVGRDQPEIEIGTAFLVAGPYDDVGNQDAAQAKTIRANTIDEMITAAGTAFLGLTVNCARCHDHKFDPISAADYHRMQATFAGVQHADRPLSTPVERQERADQLKPLQEQQAALNKQVADLEAAILKRTAEAPTIKEFKLPKVDPYLTEDRFPPVLAKQIRLVIRSNNRDPRNAGGVRIDEFEVWSADQPDRNVALGKNGTKAEAAARSAQDFMAAYAPGLVNDGIYDAKWIADGAATLTLIFARPERIDRITFSSDRQKSLPAGHGQNTFVGEYLIEISMDGSQWTTVADSLERPPLNAAFVRERDLQRAILDAERQERDALQRLLAQVNAAIRRVPDLPVAWAGRFEQPKENTYVMLGGDPARRGEDVAPASLTTLSRVTPPYALAADAPEADRRLALAKWIVSPDNPLTARVLANRVWHYHFGTGIVDTPSDFGNLGGLPSHPELLDWLARRLHTHGWQLKPLHREIMLSQTYQQASASAIPAAQHARAADVDADNRLLWSFPSRRLSAEEIRDTMLSVAGVLRADMGGPGFRLFEYLQDNVATYLPLDQHGPETYRRAVYHHNARASRIDLMTDFDSPDCTLAEPARNTTTSPLQALTLLNHSFTVDMAAAMATRLMREAGTADANAQVRRAFLLAYGRSPVSEESTAAARLIREHGLPAFTRALLNSNELIHVE